RLAEAKQRALERERLSSLRARGGFAGGVPASGMDRFGGEGKDKAQAAPGYRYALETRKALADQLQLGGSVATAASAAKVGDFFQYAIDKAVTLPRQKSALLPIVGKDVAGSRVSIYNERTQAKFPLLGLKFKNTSGLHLMQGPITVFEGSNYAGDARILDL